MKCWLERRCCLFAASLGAEAVPCSSPLVPAVLSPHPVGLGGSWKHRAALGAGPSTLLLVLLPPSHIWLPLCDPSRAGDVEPKHCLKPQASAPGGREGQEKQGAGTVAEDSTGGGLGVRSSHPADTFLLSRHPGIPFASLKPLVCN